jgi:hypothetical protein
MSLSLAILAGAPIEFCHTKTIRTQKNLGKTKLRDRKKDRKWSHLHKRKPPTARMLADASAIAIPADAPIAFLATKESEKKNWWKQKKIENEAISINGSHLTRECSQTLAPLQSLQTLLLHF